MLTEGTLTAGRGTAVPTTGPTVRDDLVRAAVVAVTWQAAMTVLGVLVEWAFAPLQAFATDPAPRPALSLLSHTDRWDAAWIHGVAEGSYATDPQTAVFYPLFPALVNLVRGATFGTLGFLAAGLLVNTVALVCAVAALRRIGRDLLPDERDARLVVGLFLTAPTAYFLHCFYSEAVFVALGFWAYAFARSRRWRATGLCLLPLTVSRVTAVLFLGLCALEFGRAHGWRWRCLLRRDALWFPASLLGWATYALSLRVVTGDAFAMFSGYGPGGHWAFNVFTPDITATLGRETVLVARALTGAAPFTTFVLVDHLLPLAGLALLLAASAYLLVVLRGDGVPLCAFGVASLLMFTLNGNLLAVHRYLLPCLVIYLGLAVLAGRGSRRLVHGVLAVNGLLQAGLFVMFTAGLWTG